MESALANIVTPVVAIAISLATFFFTQWRAQKIDDRAAAQSTVEMLMRENGFLVDAMKALHERVGTLERKSEDCERERQALTLERDNLRTQLAVERAHHDPPPPST